MGVHGLTTYLRENKRFLFQQLRFQPSDKIPTNLVVDAWSFIFKIIHSGSLEWVYGGEYSELGRLVTVVVRGWLAVGLQPHFVFDGPINPLKFGTLVSRATENIIRRSELFFRTSPTERSHPDFLDENRLLPPLTFETVVEAIKSLMREGLPVKLYFADEEGDPYAVELAGKLNGYVIGTDSDFTILNAGGYKGYIPLDDLLWGNTNKPSEVNRGIIPPMTADVSQTFLTCSVTSPAALASHLQLPVSLLPLLGALVGNDFSASPSTGFGERLFFDGVPLSRRIARISDAIRDKIPNPAYDGAGGKPEGRNGVIDLTRRVVHTLLLQDAQVLTPDEESEIIKKIVESTLQYALPAREGGALRSPGPSCLLWNPGDVHPHGRDLGKIVRQRYLDGYRIGNVSLHLLNPLHTGTMWARPFLEDPQKETVQLSVGRPIRGWIYAILGDGVGLPERLGEGRSGAKSKMGGGSGVGRRNVVTEYVRRGSSFVPEGLRVGFLPELLEELGISLDGPIQLEPESDRLRLLLAIIGIEGAAEKLRNIPPEQIIPVLAVRWVVSVLRDRVVESGGSRDRLAEKWTRSEVEALLLAFTARPTPGAWRAAPEIRSRHIQLTAQVLTSIGVIILLAQVLLLDLNRYLPLNLVTHFSGKEFHRLLNDGRTEASSKTIDHLMDVVTTGLDADAFAGGDSNMRKVLKGQQELKTPPRIPPPGGKPIRGGGRRGQRLPRKAMLDPLADDPWADDVDDPWADDYL